jgi:L,D-transpeptidase ErfK/SrfK
VNDVTDLAVGPPGSVEPAPDSSRWPRSFPVWPAMTVAAVAVAGALAVVVGAAVGGTVHQTPLRTMTGSEVTRPPDRAVVRRLARLVPLGRIVVIDSARGRLRVLRNGIEERSAACSAGSGTILVEPGARVWVFDTPLGERRVVEKRRDPIWTKPDWAFVEEGTLPPKDWSERRDDVSLGDFALSLGDGYLIHGTLFQSLLGQPVTHGCIRLGDEDLEYVWRTVDVGTRVYLY